MEKRILPADDDTVADLASTILENLPCAGLEVSESAETGLPIVELRGRRFRVELVEIA